MDQLSSYLHDLEHVYYDTKRWLQAVTLDDVVKSKLIPATAAVILIYYLVRKWCAGGACKSKARLDGKTVIVTGCTAGIGKETARDLYGRGARVIMACRNQKKAQTVTTEIFNSFKNVDGSTVGELVNYTLDLSSMNSIRGFCKEILEKEENIDILINNAGIIQDVNKNQLLTEDGFDLTIGTNHLGPFLLTSLLLEKLSESKHKPARIINVASRAYEWGGINTKDLNFGAAVPYPGAFKAYGQSKLCNIFFTQELAKRTTESNISSYVLHPGTVSTDIAVGKFPWYVNLLIKPISVPLMWLFSKTLKEGAQTTIFCAVDESIENESGKYYVDCKESPLTSVAKDDETAEKLWMLSEKLVKLEET